MGLEPAKLSDFLMAGTLGTGTTAKVYEATHRASGRSVAIKVMDQATAASETRERFAREAILLAGVESRFVGKILGYGFDRGQPFLVLERLHGETLDAKLRRDGPIAPSVAFRWIEQVLLGVRDCHDAKVIHRDIKPSNLFLHYDGFEECAKLIDFGVARLREIGEGVDLTGTNHMIGSMAYMAPEQFHDPASVGFQADLYAVGVVVYRTLTGRLPFVSRSVEAVVRMKDEQTPPAISTMGGALQIPFLDAFVWRSMDRDPDARFQSAREMLEQWRAVAVHLEEDLTDINVGRVDESYAGPRPRPRPSSPPVDSSATPSEAFEEDRTVRQFRQPAAPSGENGWLVPPTAPPPSGGPRSHETVTRILAVPPAPETALMGPITERGEVPPSGPAQVPQLPPLAPGEASSTAPPPHGPLPPIIEDMPTRTDPGLRDLVERELALHRKREPKP